MRTRRPTRFLTPCVAATFLLRAVGGAAAAVLVENFDAATFPPAGWVLTNYVSSPVSWVLSSAVSERNQTGGTSSAAMVYSSGSPWTAYNCSLTTPSISLPPGSAGLNLRFRSILETWSGDKLADIDVSIDGAATWTNLWRQQNSDRREGIEAVPLTAWLGNNACFRFRYYNPSAQAWDLYWQIDDIRVDVPLAGDISYDGVVDMADLLMLAACWARSEGQTGFTPAADLNQDNVVNVVDLLILADDWGQTS